jgi:hypothetical protein
MAGAFIQPTRHATLLRGVDQFTVMWRDEVPPVRSGARNRPRNTTIMDWATAEPPAQVAVLTTTG